MLTPTFDRVLLEQLGGSTSPVIVGPDHSWTGSECVARAGGAAAWLDAHGVAGDRAVPALLDSSPSALAHALAGALTGRPLAPLDTRSTTSELAATIKPLGADVLLCDLSSAALGADVAAAVGLRLLVIQEPPVVEYDWSGRAGDVAVILHTSGTTGLPKAVPVRSAPLMARATSYAGPSGLQSGDVFCTGAPMHHTAGFGMALVAWLLGAGVATLPRFTVDAWRWVQQVRPTHVLLVPSMIEMLLAEGELDAGMRTIIYGASPIHPDTLVKLVRTLPQARLVQIFGQTEVSPVTALTHDDHLAALGGAPHLLSSVGRPVAGLEMRLDEADDDGIGEVIVRADHTFQSDADGWHRTGDLGRQDAQGFLYLVGRRGDMIIRGGENIYPIEVERVLSRHPAVREVAVLGFPDRRLGEVLRAVIIPHDPDQPPSIDELRSHAGAVLPRFKVPEVWEFSDVLPRNASGKVLRRLLRT